jgi:hypothetical protein
MHLFEKNSIHVYTRKKAGDGQGASSMIKSLVITPDGGLVDAAQASSHPPEVGLVVAEIEITGGAQAEVALFEISNIFQSIETLGTCRRCGNAVRGVAGSKRVIFCKAKPIFGACGNYEFVTAIIDDCPRYEDSPSSGIIFDTEKIGAATYVKTESGWEFSEGEMPGKYIGMFAISADNGIFTTGEES